MSIDPPDKKPTPKWAVSLLNAARSRNSKRGANRDYEIDDLLVAWRECGGCCAVSGLPFSLQIYGDGQARRPFAPSLDRIDRHKPYERGNVRLVAAIANFAMNAWGEKPLHRLAMAIHRKLGDVRASEGVAPSDAELDAIATEDADSVESDIGIVEFPPRPDLYQPIIKLLCTGDQSSRQIEDWLAGHFQISPDALKARLRSNCPAWRNHVAWALVDLGTNARGSGDIKRLRGTRAPDGGSMGIYTLLSRDVPGRCAPMEGDDRSIDD